jgi:hypothetical protein
MRNAGESLKVKIIAKAKRGRSLKESLYSLPLKGEKIRMTG